MKESYDVAPQVVMNYGISYFLCYLILSNLIYSDN